MPSEMFTIELADPTQHRLMYTFIFDGNVNPADAGGGVSSVGELERDGGNVTIQNRSDGTVQVDGRTGGDYGDAFEVDGTLMSFSSNFPTSGVVLNLGGQTITPANLPLETGDPGSDDGNGDGNGDQQPDDGNGDTSPDDGNGGDQQPSGDGWFSNITPGQAMVGLATFGVAYTVASDIDD